MKRKTFNNIDLYPIVRQTKKNKSCQLSHLPRDRNLQHYYSVFNHEFMNSHDIVTLFIEELL